MDSTSRGIFYFTDLNYPSAQTTFFRVSRDLGFRLLRIKLCQLKSTQYTPLQFVTFPANYAAMILAGSAPVLPPEVGQ